MAFIYQLALDGHDHLGKFRLDDIADLTGIDYSGFQSDRELQD